MTMTLKPIHTEEDYQDALARIEEIWDTGEDTPESEELEVLSMLVEAYEKTNFPIGAPDPIDYLQFVMDNRGLSRKDLEPFIGPRGRVSDILNRTRPLSLEMIRRLSFGLDLPASVLIQDYPIRKRAA
jgi:HTH-type transcriptional regulator/antitoxin HigA